MTKDDKQTKPSDIVAEAKKRFERAKQAYSSNRMLAVEDTRFAMGDSDNGGRGRRTSATAERSTSVSA